MNKSFLTILMLIVSLTAFAQRSPEKEILIFFKEGVIHSSERKDGDAHASTKINSQKLQASLLKLGISESMLEIALPRFKRTDTLKKLQDGTLLKLPDMTNLYRFKMPDGISRKELVKNLSSIQEIIYAEENGVSSPLVNRGAFTTPTDPGFSSQWALKNNSWIGADIHAEGAWNIFTGSSNSIVAVLDGGISSHEDIDPKIAYSDSGYGAEWVSHGNSVASIILAEANNGKGIAGVDWNARLLNRRIDDKDDADTYQVIIDAISYSSNVNVLNYSWGHRFNDLSQGRYSITTARAVAAAYKANRVSVGAIGNHQDTQPGVTSYPAGYNNVIAVGATIETDEIYPNSVAAPNISVVAPGNFIQTARNGYNVYDNTFSATSAATPHVAGIASLLKGYKPSLKNDDIKNIIEISADQVDLVPGFDNAFGHGRVNAESALKLLQPTNSLNHLNTTGGTVYASSGWYHFTFFDTPGYPDVNYRVKRHEVRKTITFPSGYCNIIGVWGRGNGSTGLRGEQITYGEGFCEVVPGSLTSTGVTLRTFIYEVTPDGSSMPIGSYPVTAANVVFAYTVLVKDNNYQIAGEKTDCSSSTFSIPNIGAATVVWSVTGSHSILGSNTGSSVNIQTTGNLPGTLTALVTTPCHTYTVTKVLKGFELTLEPGGNGYCGEATVSVNAFGTPSITWTFTGDLQIDGALSQTHVTTDKFINITGTEGTISMSATICGATVSLSQDYSPYKRDITIVSNLPLLPNDPLSAFVNLDYSVDTYRWYMNNTLDFDNTTSNFWINDRDKDGRRCGMNTLRLEVDLSCGSSVVVGEIQFEQLCSEWFRAYQIFPNPASSFIQVGPTEELVSKMGNTEKSRLKDYDVTLLDKSGRILMKVRSNDKKAVLNTANVPSGQYYIHLKADGEKEVVKKQIVIKN